MKILEIGCIGVLTALSITKGRPEAQQPQGSVLAVLTCYHVKPEYDSRLRMALKNYVLAAMKAPGNIMVEAYHERKDTSLLWTIERWSNPEAFDKNKTSKIAKAIIDLAQDGLVSPAEIILVTDLEPQPKSAYHKAAAKGDQPLTMMLFVNSKEGTEDNFKSVYHTAMPQFRGEQGVLAYQLSQINGDKTKFVTYEKFRNQAAFEYHLKFPPIEPVLRYLRTSIENPPFENSLHQLIEFAPGKRNVVTTKN